MASHCAESSYRTPDAIYITVVGYLSQNTLHVVKVVVGYLPSNLWRTAKIFYKLPTIDYNLLQGVERSCRYL